MHIVHIQHVFVSIWFSFVSIAFNYIYSLFANGYWSTLYPCSLLQVEHFTVHFDLSLCRQHSFIHLTKLQVAVATNPTHYGNPSTGCESDEQAVKVQGLSGDFCSPKCDSSATCTSDVPKGDTATPECALRTTTGDKYCALICQSDSDCGSQVAFQMFV